MSFQNLALKLEAKNKSNTTNAAITEFNERMTDVPDTTKTNKNLQNDIIEKKQLLYELFLKLKVYHESREEAVASIREFVRKYPKTDYTDNHSLAKLLSNSIPAKKLLDYYSSEINIY